MEEARAITKRIEVTVEKGMNVMTVSYKDPDPVYATRFLEELLKNYREKHLEIHRFPQALDVIAHRRDEVRKQLEQTESELKQLRNTVESLSVAESTATLSAAIGKAQEELNAAEADRRGQEARVEALERMLPASALTAASGAGRGPSDQDTERHRFLVQLLSELRERERSLLAMYPPESRMVRIPRKQISELEAQRRALEGRYPDLALIDPLNENSQTQVNVVTERAKLAAMKATEEVLRTQLAGLQERRVQFADLAPRIARLELEKQVLEVNYKNIETNLGKAQDDRAVDWSKVSNIASVQEPSPAAPDKNPLKQKLTLGLMLSGVALGVGLAFLREAPLQRKLKRPSELEEHLQIPLLLSIPFNHGTSRNHNRALTRFEVPRLQNGQQHTDRAPWAANHFIRPFCEAIRDHILLSFEIRNLDHKPKLIGVTGFSAGAGSTTLAAGVAAALSETGDGKVLLVDMNVEEGEAHPFLHGAPALSLSEILEAGNPPPTATDNLYIATADTAKTKRVRMGLRRLNNLVPSLRAADFDYIIFDMPMLDATSITLGMAAFLDKVILVIEAERTDRETVKRFYSDLTEIGTDVSCVFNKTRSYGPKWLEGEA